MGSYISEPRAAMNAQTEFEACLSLPVVAQFRRSTKDG